MTRIGLIEDNLDLRNDLAFYLRRQQFDVVLESDGQNIDLALTRHPCDLIVLDLGLPGEDGLSIARRLRQGHPRLGIVMLTARGDLDDRLTGLLQGADAYLVKPVDFRELVAVLQSLERRLSLDANEAAAGGQAPAPAWELQATAHRLVSPEGNPIELTYQETRLIELMASAYPQPALRDQLLSTCGDQVAGLLDYRRLEVAMSRLRKKLDDFSAQPLVLNARGVGYRLTSPVRCIYAG